MQFFRKKSCAAGAMILTLIMAGTVAAADAAPAAPHPEQLAVQTPEAPFRQARHIKSKTAGAETPPAEATAAAPAGEEEKDYLTPEQKEMLARERDKLFLNWDRQTEEERQQTIRHFLARINEEKMKNMSAEERSAFLKEEAERKTESEKVSRMTDEERHTYFLKKHRKQVKANAKAMEKAERKAYLKQEKMLQERQQKFWDRWKKMTPDERKQWRKEHPFITQGVGKGDNWRPILGVPGPVILPDSAQNHKNGKH